jgi:hypothetical protein
MRNSLLLITLILILASCNNTDQAHSAVTVIDSTSSKDSADAETDSNLLTENSISTLNNSGIYKFAKEKSPEFEWKNFELVRFWKVDDAARSEKFLPEKNYYQAYGSFLKYAPDSSRFIDLDSYNIDIRRNKDGKLIGYEQGPDVEVSLIDLNKKEKKRLLFLGPGNSVEDATWIDNDNLLLIGTAVDSAGTGSIPTVWKYNVPDRSFQVYETTDPEIARNLKGYWKNVRLRSVSFQQ